MLLQKREILNRWKEHFKEILTDNNQENLLIECYIHDVEKEVLNPPHEETVTIIHQLKDNKAPRNYNITSELIKVAGPVLWKQIHELITNIWEKEKIPDDWKIEIIYPIHKKGDKTVCDNYRGITLLSRMYKIMSCLIYNRINQYAEKFVGE
jgi:hypothetical protein